MSSFDRRRAILQAASRLIEHYGHGKTTIADVAREADVGVGTVYLEFSSKDALVAELSFATHAAVLDAMRAASATYQDHPSRLRATLMKRTEAFVALRERGPHACELLHCKVEGVRSAHRRFREHERTMLEVIVHEGQRLGSFCAHEPSSTAVAIQHAFACLSPPSIFALDGDPVRLSADLCDLLLRGLLAARAASPGRPRASHQPKASDASTPAAVPKASDAHKTAGAPPRTTSPKAASAPPRTTSPKAAAAHPRSTSTRASATQKDATAHPRSTSPKPAAAPRSAGPKATAAPERTTSPKTVASREPTAAAPETAAAQKSRPKTKTRR